MKKYDHSNPKTNRDRQFIEWCKQNVREWPKDAAALASFSGGKFKNYTAWRRVDGLSHLWSVCTLSQWKSC